MAWSRCRAKIHDRYQVEVKLEYPIAPERPREVFHVDAYFFVPNALGIHQATYSQPEFYQDLQTYTRYGTPALSLEQLLDETNELSPFTRIARLKEPLHANPRREEDAATLEYELRILGCIFRGETQDRGGLISQCLAGAHPPPKNLQDAAYLCDKFLESSSRVLEGLRQLQRQFLDPRMPPVVVQAFRRVDEALSVQLEGVCGKINKAFSRLAQVAPDETAEAAGQLAAAMRREEDYRREAGYPCAVDASSRPDAERVNENYLARLGALKKYLQSPLFLSVSTGKGSRPATITTLAAVVGMAFFMLVSWILMGQAQPPANSFSYMLLVIIVYAFRENIKESIKTFLNDHMTGWLRDRESNLIDRSVGRKVGHTSEAMVFMPFSRVPHEVREKRGADELVEMAEAGAAEAVIKYQKSVKVYSKEVFSLHRRLNCLNEIMRFNVRKFLFRMDEPKKGLTICEALASEGWKQESAGKPEPGTRASRPQMAGGTPAIPMAGKMPAFPEGSPSGRQDSAGLTSLQRVHATKVYHVNVVLVISKLGKDGQWAEDIEKFCLVLSRDGIERMETGERGEA